MRVRVSGLQIKIIWRMHRHGKYGRSHTSTENATKGFPSHLGREVREGLHDLVKRGMIVAKPTTYGLQVSLNEHRIEAIWAICDFFKARSGDVRDWEVYEIEAD